MLDRVEGRLEKRCCLIEIAERPAEPFEGLGTGGRVATVESSHSHGKGES